MYSGREKVFYKKFVVEECLMKISMYERAKMVVSTKQGGSKELKVMVGVHQGSVLSPWLFAVAMEVSVREV